MLGGTESRELAERGRELAALGAALDGASAGHGAIVLIEGPSGVGKTSLLRAAGELAVERRLAVLACRGSELRQDLPFGCAHQLLGEGADLPAGPAEVDRSLEVLSSLRSLTLQAAHRDEVEGALLLVDDAHVADKPSLRFLCHLAFGIEEAPLAIVIGIRTDAAAAANELLAELRAAPGATTLRPQPLSSAAVASIVKRTWGDETPDDVVAACAGVSGGNPFYLSELLREFMDSPATPSVENIQSAAPRTVLYAVMARLGRCGPDATALATALAVIGDRCSLSLTARLAELAIPAAERAADTLARAEILAAGDPLHFTHPLIASSLYGDIGAFARARLHARMARILRDEGAPADQIATHLLRASTAGDPEVVETLRDASKSALARGEPEAAAKLLQRALAEPPPDELRGELLLELANAEATAGRREAIPHFEEAIESVTDPVARARAHLSLARTLHHGGDFGRAAELAERGCENLNPHDALAEELLSVWLAAAMLHAPLLGRMGEYAAPLIERAEAGWMPLAPGLRSQLSSWITSRDRPAETAAALAEAAFEADPLVDGDPRGAALGFAAASLVFLDRLQEAEAELDRAVESAKRRGAVIALSIARHFQAYVHHHRGRLREAVACAERSLEIYRYGWTDSPWSIPILALAQIHLGDLGAAREAIKLGEDAGPDRVEHALLLESRAALSLAAGEPERALEDARAAGKIAEEAFQTRSSRIFDWCRLAALAADRADRHAEALDLAEGALRRAEAGGTPRQLGTALCAAGLIRGGHEGVGLLERAVAALDRSPSRYYLLEAKLELGSAMRRVGRRSAAREMLFQALELADEFGAQPAIARARTELASLGLRPRQSARAGLGSLTPAERRVASLASSGKTTKEIAAELYLSPKTVENHLTRIYRKLDIQGRAGLASKLGSAPKSLD